MDFIIYKKKYYAENQWVIFYEECVKLCMQSFTKKDQNQSIKIYW